MLRDLTGTDNETRLRTYFWVHLFGLVCPEQGGGRRGGGRREGGERGPLGAPHKVTTGAPFTASSAGNASVCPHTVRLTRGGEKINRKPNQINVQLINSAAKNLPLRDRNHAPRMAPPPAPHKGDDE